MAARVSTVSLLCSPRCGLALAFWGHWDVFVPMPLRRPVLGTVGGTYQYVYTQFRSIPFYAKLPVSVVFEELVDLGILGQARFSLSSALSFGGVYD